MPAIIERAPPIRNGGIDTIASLIARYVEPHTTHTASSAAPSAARDGCAAAACACGDGACAAFPVRGCGDAAIARR